MLSSPIIHPHGLGGYQAVPRTAFNDQPITPSIYRALRVCSAPKRGRKGGKVKSWRVLSLSFFFYRKEVGKNQPLVATRVSTSLQLASCLDCL